MVCEDNYHRAHLAAAVEALGAQTDQLSSLQQELHGTRSELSEVESAVRQTWGAQRQQQATTANLQRGAQHCLGQLRDSLSKEESTRDALFHEAAALHRALDLEKREIAELAKSSIVYASQREESKETLHE